MDVRDQFSFVIIIIYIPLDRARRAESNEGVFIRGTSSPANRFRK